MSIMTLPHTTPGTVVELGEIRQDLFDVHVPWHRISTVVDITVDAGRLLDPILTDYPEITALVVDLTGNVPMARERLIEHTDRVEVRSGDVLDDVPAGADYYLLPDGVEALGAGRLRRLMRSVSRACLPRGRAMVCVPVESAADVVRTAESAGLEVTRTGQELGMQLIEFGAGMLRALPGQ